MNRILRDVSKSIPPALIYLAIFLVAFVPRALALDAYVAPDEGKWIYRSAHFLQALLKGDLAQTTSVAATPDVEVLAPAVPTMWTGALGLAARYWLEPAHGFDSLNDYLEAIPKETEKIPLDYYPWTRFPTVLLASLTIPFFYFFLAKLMTPKAALLAAWLLALDPFFLGLSRLIHHDALVSIFIIISLLSLLACRRPPSLSGSGTRLPGPWLLLSAVAGGLALLTKPTALYLVIFAGLFFLVEATNLQKSGSPNFALRRFVTGSLSWGLVALLTFVVVWPAMWVSPFDTLVALFERATNAIGDNNNYSLIPAPGDPLPELGFLFYPVNWLFKTTLPAMIGLAGLGLGRWRGWLTNEPEIGSANSQNMQYARKARNTSSVTPTTWTARWLVIFALLFLLLLIPAGTRDIRYLLPAIPALYALAAPGLLTLTNRLAPAPHASRITQYNVTRQHLRYASRRKLSHAKSPRRKDFNFIFSFAFFAPWRKILVLVAAWPRYALRQTQYASYLTPRSWALGLLLAIQLALAILYWPYFVDYWNPVIGGPWLAPGLVKIGSGEGLDQMGRYLSQKPDAAQLTVATSFWESFVPFFSGRYTKAHYEDEADYIIIYRRQIQNRNPFPEYWTYFSARAPEYKVTLVGLDYAWLYPGPQLRVVRNAEFDDGLTLRGYRLEKWAAQPGQPAYLTLVWAGATPDRANQAIRVQLIDRSGRRWAGAGGPLLDPDGPSPVEGHYLLDIPAQAPRADYGLWVSVPAANSSSRLAQQVNTGKKVGQIPVRQLDRPQVQFPAAVDFGDLITFGGADVNATLLSGQGTGGVVEVKLLWQARQPLSQSYTTFVHLVDEAGHIWGQADRIPGVGEQELPTPVWDTGEWIVDLFQLSLKPGIPAGHYAVLVGLYQSQTLERLPVVGGAENQTVVEITSMIVPGRDDR